MANAVIYARYSSHNQRDESIEDQVRVCKEAAAREGDKIVHIYADRAISGTSTDKRAAFAEMISDSASGSWSKVYVYKTDRFARNRFDSAINKSKLKKNGVRVVSATENIQDGPDGVLLEAVLEGLAEYYSVNLGENVKRGMHGNALNCLHNGVNIYGYDHGQDGHFVINETEARVVRMTFEMYVAGLSMSEIAAALLPYRTKQGNRFTVQSIGNMLRNEKYAGVYKFKDVRIEGGVPAIVDRETFERVQHRLALRTRKRRCPMTFLLSGMLFDIEGHRYIGHSGYGKSGKKYLYYRCKEAGNLVPKDRIEEAVASAVRTFLDSDHVAGVIADLVLEEQDEALMEDIETMDAFRDRIASNNREHARLVNLAAKIGATDDIVSKLKSLEDEEASLKSELAEMERGTPIFDREHIEFWVHEIVGKKDPLEVISLFVKRVVLDHENDEMYIEFIFDDDYRDDKSGKCSRKFKSGLFGENEQTPSSETESRGSLNSQVAAYVKLSTNMYVYGIRRGFCLLVVGVGI